MSWPRLTSRCYAEKMVAMSDRETLLQELKDEPDEIARKLLEYLHTLKAGSRQLASQERAMGQFEKYWKRYYGALEGAAWDEPGELPPEKREDW